MKILIVDDSKIIHDLIGAYFADKNQYQLTFIENPEEVLPCIKKTVPDLVTLDLNLGKTGNEGFALLQQIKQRFPSVKVIMISASNEKSTGLKALELGADDYILKPFSKQELLQCIYDDTISTV